MTKVSDISLIYSSRETYFRNEAMVSRIAQLSLLDALTIGISLLRQEETLANLQKIREAIALKQY